jgi:hypothetical protein
METHNQKIEDGLKEIDGHLLDGLTFCKNVYRLFEKASSSPSAISSIRQRKRPFKKLVEELLPLAWYVQTLYRYRNRVRIKWIDGSQNFDAYVTQPLGEHHVEITVATYKAAHLKRKLLDEVGITAHPTGIAKNRETGELVSRPVVLAGRKAENDFSEIIVQAIRKKLNINYPPNTTLIVQCEGDSWFGDMEWDYVFRRTSKRVTVGKFTAIFMVSASHRHYATIKQNNSDAIYSSLTGFPPTRE